MNKLIFLIIIIIASATVGGFYTMKYWEWFVLPVFPTLPKLTYMYAVGFAFYINYIKGHLTGKKSDDEFILSEWMEQFFIAHFHQLAVFGIGYIIHLFY